MLCFTSLVLLTVLLLVHRALFSHNLICQVMASGGSVAQACWTHSFLGSKVSLGNNSVMRYWLHLSTADKYILLYSTLQLYLALNTFCYEPYSHIPAALYSIPLSAFDEAQSHPNASIRSNLELSILPEDTSDCGLEELGIKPLTFQLADNLLYLLSHSWPSLWVIQ